MANDPVVYLAGPDVFLPEPLARAEALKLICRRHGLLGVSPLDGLPGEPDGQDAPAIANRNERHIRQCSAVLANLTPFRGPSADAGTAYEVGFARALGRPVFGYACAPSDYAARVRAMPGAGGQRDRDGLLIEDFGLCDNLMIACGIEASGGFVITGGAGDPWTDLSVFERCITRAAPILRQAMHRR